MEEARENLVQDQKEALTVLKKGQEVSVPDDRMNAALAVRPMMTAGKNAVELVVQGREAQRLKVSVVPTHLLDQAIAAMTLNQEVLHDQAVVRKAVRVNAVQAPVVEKTDQKDHLRVLAKGHLPLEGRAQEKHQEAAVAGALHPERAMANAANARRHGT